MDIRKVRGDFPILNTGVVYLDSAASSLTPEPVIQKMLEFYRQYRANVMRGVHELSQRASGEYERAHAKVAEFINAKSASEIIMTKNTTEGINLVAGGLRWDKGDKIVTTLIEHHSNFIVWLRVRQRYGVDLEIVRPNREGLIDLTEFEKAIDDRTKLVTVTQASNVLGVVLPVGEIVRIAHEHGALVLVDGAQSVPHLKVDVQKIGCDFLAFSGHKMCAPTGSGTLYIKDELTEQIEPLCIGGGTIDDVGIDHYKLAKSPMRFEAGTPAIAEAIGLGAATDYLKGFGMKEVETHEKKLTKRAYYGLRGIPKVEVYGPEPRHRIGVMSFNVGDLNPHDVALALDTTANIVVRSGRHCASPLMKELLHKSGTVRASVYLYNSAEEVERLISTVSEIANTRA